MYLTVLFVIVIYQQLHPRLFGKAIATPEMFQVCRFCSCQDEALLIPLEDILDFGLAFQDVSIVTGIEINEENIASYAMCLECTTKLKSSVTFRNACISNDFLFRKLCPQPTTSIQESCAQKPEAFDLARASVKESGAKTPDVFDLAGASVEESGAKTPDVFDLAGASVEESGAQTPNADNSCDESQHFDLSVFGTIFVESLYGFNQSNIEEDEFSYSANFIKPGEILFSEDEDSNQSIDWDRFSLNPRPPPSVAYIRVKGKRKFHLCDKCGLMVGHIPSHMDMHQEEYKHSCPYCPLKVKNKGSMNSHIKTVHLKTVMKTCEICGKGFIHHKTYRYHMLNHQDAGKTFECVDCSKTFTNSIYLRDHFNRIHNTGKQVKKKDTGERIRRKRSRSGSEKSNIDSE
ncbi:zinc finger protein 28 homolog isoform X1 [Anopheles funestus]